MYYFIVIVKGDVQVDYGRRTGCLLGDVHFDYGRCNVFFLLTLTTFLPVYTSGGPGHEYVWIVSDMHVCGW